jgi:hypothetical protein
VKTLESLHDTGSIHIEGADGFVIFKTQALLGETVKPKSRQKDVAFICRLPRQRGMG